MNSTNVADVEDYRIVFQTLWFIGIAVSWLGLLVQCCYFYKVPPCRKHDEKILTMLTVSRIVNTICEYLMMHVTISGVLLDVVNVIYFQTDFALVCWMFVFSKNLYDKVVLVFSIRKCGLVTTSLIIFIISLLIGLITPFLLHTNVDYFRKYYKIYCFIKFVIIVINALIFVEIFSVAFKRGSSVNKNISNFIKAAIISFILVCITSLQVLVTDLLSIFLGSNEVLINIFCVISSFQVVSVTLIFIILARGKAREAAISRSITLNYREAV